MVSAPIRWIGALIWIAAASAIVVLLMFVAFHRCLESIEADSPELLPLPDPPLCFLERLGFDADEMRSAVFPPRDQPRLFEHFHMLGCSGEGHREGFGQLADRFLAERKIRKHPAPRRIRQRSERRIESIFNHMV